MGDCISRQTVLTYIEFILTHGMGKKKSFEFIKKFVEKLPPVTQKQKMGHWVKVTNGRGGYECDVCRNYAPSYKNGDEWLTRYCPNCGARMEVSENG